MKPGRFLSLALVGSLFLAGVSGCGNSESGQNADSADTSAMPDTAEVDQAVRNYVTSTDSLASLFSSLGSVDDVIAMQDEIRRLSGELRAFNEQAARTGLFIQERMDAIGTTAPMQKLIDSRKRLDSLENVAAAVGAIENGKEISRQDSASQE